MPKVKTVSRATDVCDQIRGLIASGEIAMGSRIKQLHVARRLNTSQTPVREAFRTLEQEGWVVSEFGRGARVRTIGAETIDQIYELRELLEGFVARKAASILTADQLAHLHTLAEAADKVEHQLEAPQWQESQQRSSRADVEFHLALAGMVKNPIIFETYERLCKMGLLMIGVTAQDPPVSNTPHADLTAAIEGREPDWAEAVARRLVRAAGARAKAQFHSGKPISRVAQSGEHQKNI
jgi:DNA-binding GntR family transcriptional regulator